jgi:Uma2 family endonuclease
MASTTSKIVTYEEWLQMPESEGKEEVVDGEIIKMPPPKWNHSLIIHQLQMMLVRQLDPDKVIVMTTIFGLVIREEPLTCREPDLAIFIRKNVIERDGYIHSAPELVVEVLSPTNTRKDMLRKTEDYESIGVPELWILSPEGRTFEVLQLQDGKLRRTQLLADGQIRPLRFPETVVDVASVWPD